MDNRHILTPEGTEQGQETGPRLSVRTKPRLRGDIIHSVSQRVIQQTHLEDLLGARLHTRASGTGMPALNSSLFNRESSP